MDSKNPFDSIKDLEPFKARPRKKPAKVPSYIEVVGSVATWLPPEIVGALSASQEVGHDVTITARSLSQIVALLRGENKSRAATRSWFSNARLERPEGQSVYLSSVLKNAKEILTISGRIRELGELRRESIAELKSATGKRGERAGAALDRVDHRIAALIQRRDSRVRDFEQLLKMVADYLSVGRTM